MKKYPLKQANLNYEIQNLFSTFAGNNKYLK